MMRTASTRRHGLRDDISAPPPADGRTAVLLAVLLGVWLTGGAGCGAVGDPIAPEDIGIEAKVRAQQQAEKRRSTPQEQQRAPRKEPEIVLPPLQPVGAQ